MYVGTAKYFVRFKLVIKSKCGAKVSCTNLLLSYYNSALRKQINIGIYNKPNIHDFAKTNKSKIIQSVLII